MDYQHFVLSNVGFFSVVDQQLLSLVKQTKPSSSLARNTGLSIKEMYVCQGGAGV